MSSFALTVYPQPPPTTNSLDSQQRARLVRSARKLGAVLGTTPCLLGNELPPNKPAPRTLKRQGSIHTHHHIGQSSITTTSDPSALSHLPLPSLSSTSLSHGIAPHAQNTESLQINPPGLSTARGCRSGNKPQLYLQLNKGSIPSTEDHDATLLSPCPPLPPTPISPTVPNDAEIRRKRMAKLTRHLGEKVPLELIFTSNPKPVPISPNRPLRQRSESVHVLCTDVVPIYDNTQETMQNWVGEWNRSNISDVQRELRNLRLK